MEQRPEKIINSDQNLRGTHQYSVRVSQGAHLLLEGTLQGSLVVETGSHVTINGKQQGSVHVSHLSDITINGSLDGSLHVEEGGMVKVSKNGRLAGSLYVDGIVKNRGVRGGTVEGSGKVLDEEGASVKQPTIVNGMHFYKW